jgi:hypothetical protein
LVGTGSAAATLHLVDHQRILAVPRLAKALAAPSRSALSLGSTVVDWLTLGVLGAATVALAISSRRAKTPKAR